MIFSNRLRGGVKSGEITCSIRIWQSPRVKVGGRYRLEPGSILVTSLREISREDISEDLAQRSGFDSVNELMEIAQHGAGDNVYLVEFEYVK